MKLSKQKKDNMQEMSFQQYGLSDTFIKQSCQPEPYFIRIDGQLTENPKCWVDWLRFLDLYKNFLWKK